MKRYVFHDVLRYWERFWKPFPLNGKIPPKGFNLRVLFSRHPTRGELGVWFPPNYQGNVGLITGEQSDLVVVDHDTREDAEWWWKRFGKTPFIVKTGKQGFHFYYRYPKGEKIGCRVGLWNRKSDLRANGGYVATYPSIHPETKQMYEWVEMAECIDMTAMTIFDLEWIMDRPRVEISNVPCVHESDRVRLIHRAESYAATIDPAISGEQGHNKMLYFCGKMLQFFGLSVEEALPIILRYNERCQPPFSMREVLHKIDSIVAMMSEK